MKTVGWHLANARTLSRFSLALQKMASVIWMIHVTAASLKIHSICAADNFNFHLNYFFFPEHDFFYVQYFHGQVSSSFALTV